MHPAGELALTGLSQSVTFYKRAMDRLGVHVDLVRIGSYKGAMEPFVMNEQSPDVRANKTRLLDDVFNRITAVDRAPTAPASGKKMDVAEVRALIDRGLFTPPQAQAAGLVDGVADQGQLEMVIARALGRPDVGITDLDTAPIAPGAWPGRRVGVVLVDGTIVDGPSQELPFGIGGVAGSDTLVAALEECRTDSTVGAVVLRVNSPGGSAFASDVIARAIVQLRAAGKPVVVSMGDLAASGGYYISAPADRGVRRAVDDHRFDRDLRDQGRRRAAGEHAGHQRRDHEPRRARRLPVALSAVDRGGGEAGDGQDALPLRPVHRDGGGGRASRAG